MKANPLQLVNGDHDVFGNGAVRIISTPGHTPGHQSLFVRLPSGEPVILTGDAAHLVENFAHRRVPSFNADAALTRGSIDKLRALAEQTGAKVLNSQTARRSKNPFVCSRTSES